MVQFKITMQSPSGALRAKLDKMAANAGQAVQNAGLVTEGSAKQRCLVDTGRLRSSIKYTKTGPYSCKIGTSVNYALPVEKGHVTRSGSFVPAHPFMFPGYLDGKAALQDDLKNISK
jgi:phage gpG-like protein